MQLMAAPQFQTPSISRCIERHCTCDMFDAADADTKKLKQLIGSPNPSYLCTCCIATQSDHARRRPSFNYLDPFEGPG